MKGNKSSTKSFEISTGFMYLQSLEKCCLYKASSVCLENVQYVRTATIKKKMVKFAVGGFLLGNMGFLSELSLIAASGLNRTPFSKKGQSLLGRNVCTVSVHCILKNIG